MKYSKSNHAGNVGLDLRIMAAALFVHALVFASPAFSEDILIPGLPPLKTFPEKIEPAESPTIEPEPESKPVPEIKEVPESPESRVFHGESLISQGKLDEAHEVFDQFLREYPSHERVPEVLVQLARLEYQAANYYGSLQFLDFLLEGYPTTNLAPTAKLMMAECYLELDQVNESEALFKEALRSHPDLVYRWRALLGLGKIDGKLFNHQAEMGKLLKLVRESEDSRIKEEATSLMKGVFENVMTVEQVKLFLGNTTDPLLKQLALERLIQVYREQRNINSYRQMIEQLITQIPQHPEKEMYLQMLEVLKGNEKQKIRLAAVLPLSGSRALVGQQVLQGIQMAINHMPRLERHKVELIVKDSGLGRTAPEMIEELATDPSVVAVIGPVLSNEVRDSAPVAERYKIPMMTPTASSAGLTGLSPTIYRNALTREMQGRFIARHAVNDLNLYRFAILYPDENFGEELREVFKNEVNALGGSVVMEVPYNRSQSDFKDQILKLGGIEDDDLKRLVRDQHAKGIESPPLDDKGGISRPVIETGIYTEEDIEGLKISLEVNYDAIYIPGFFDKIALIAPQLAFYNIDNVTLLGTSGWNSQELVNSTRNYLGSAVFVDGFYSGSDRPEVQEFVTEFTATFGEEPSSLSAQSYDAANIFLELINKGAKSRVDIQERLPGVQGFPGVSGQTAFTKTGESRKYLAKLKIKGKRIVQLP